CGGGGPRGGAGELHPLGERHGDSTGELQPQGERCGGGAGELRPQGDRRRRWRRGAEAAQDHIVFHCPVAVAFWRQVGFELNAHATVEALQSLTASSPAPNPHGSVFLFLCCWNIWKHRNRVVFDGAEPCLQRLLRNCNEDVRLWSWRLPRADAGVIESWCNL
ncbi:hypothetical protein PVAP13_3NG079534, partial [Panicum virgatum]